MEDQNQNNLVLYVLLFLVLIGGGVGIFLATRPKKEEIATKTPGGGATLTGRESVTLTEEEMVNITLTGNAAGGIKPPQTGITTTTAGGTTTTTPPPPAIYIHSAQGKKLIDDMATALQSDQTTMNKIVKKYNIGSPFVSSQNFSAIQQSAIDKLFQNVQGVVPGDSSTYPIYGTQEPGGAALRAKLQNIVNKGVNGLNLTDLRDSSYPWWISDISLNLMTGSNDYGPMDPHSIWMGWESSDKLEFYKKLNGHMQVSDYKWLLEKPNGKAGYPGAGILKLADLWVQEIDRLDESVRKEAILQLQQNGFNLTYTQA